MRALHAGARAVFAFSLLAVAGTAAIPNPFPGAAQRSFEWDGEMAPGTTLRIFSFSGDITVRETSGRTARVHGVTRNGDGGDVRYTADGQGRGGAVLICALRSTGECTDEGVRDRGSWRRNSRLRADFVVELPRGVELRVGTGNGKVGVDGADANVHASSGNGEVRVGAGAERVNASSGNGAVLVEGARGPVEASSGNGRVTVRTAAGPVTASSGNGNIDVSMASLRASGDMRFSSGNGSVTLTLPAGFSGEVDASTGNGGFQSDFPVQVQGRMNRNRVRGTIGDGGPTLRISTGNGSITLRRGGAGE